MLGDDGLDRIVVGRLAEQIDADDASRPQAKLLRGRDAALEACRIHVEAVGEYVDEHRRRADQRDDFRSRGKGEARAEHRVACLDAARLQDQHQRISAVRAAHNLLRAAERREVGLEHAHFGPENVLPMSQHARDRVVDGAAEAAALGGKIDEGDRRRSSLGVLVHCAFSYCKRQELATQGTFRFVSDPCRN